jgi:hypothetical protein
MRYSRSLAILEKPQKYPPAGPFTFEEIASLQRTEAIADAYLLAGQPSSKIHWPKESGGTAPVTLKPSGIHGSPPKLVLDVSKKLWLK